MGKLTPEFIRGATVRGRYPDGDGLYLQVIHENSKSWLYRYQASGKERWHGLGSARDLSLAKARLKRDSAREQVRAGKDLVADKRTDRDQQKLEEARSLLFREAAEKYLESKAKEWGNAKHRQQWGATLRTYVYPVIGEMRLQDVTTESIMEVLDPIWDEKPATARRVRGRIEKIIAWATFRKFRTGENPARWDGHLEEAGLTKRPPVVHFPSLPVVALPAFMKDLRGREGTSPRALEFTILTANRTGAVIGAKWREVDFANALWTVPKERMKGRLDARKPHVVPLCKASVALLESLPRDGEFIFPGMGEGKPLSDMAMLACLQRIGTYTDEHGERITTHGFRTTFRNYAAEKRPDLPGIVAEMALAHTLGDEVQEAYLRTDLLDLRRELMQSWSDYALSAQASARG